jgi:3-dehydroquinate dehydratase-2
MKKKILVIFGVNLNLMGERQVNIYGSITLDEISAQIIGHARKLSFEVDTFQSNIEGEIVNKIHSARNGYEGIIINAGAYTHYSYAIRDAISSIKVPCIEVHQSNIYQRDEFRHKSVIAAVCAGQISGFGQASYLMALDGLYYILKGV